MSCLLQFGREEFELVSLRFGPQSYVWDELGVVIECTLGVLQLSTECKLVFGDFVMACAIRGTEQGKLAFGGMMSRESL